MQADSKDFHVGASQEFNTMSAVKNQLQPGDRVLIHPGTYHQAVKITAKGEIDRPILIQGVGNNKPVFDAEGLNVSGEGSVPRAIFQIEGSNIIIDNLEFKNARNGNNGAGIRLNQSENVIIRNSSIYHCDMGIQGGDKNTVTIENCDIGFNGTPDYNGYSHNFYMTGNAVIVRRCYIHDSLYGQNYKSRAHYNELWYNWIENSNEGEAGFVDGQDDTSRPDSHIVMIGNAIISKADRTGNKAKFVLAGSESGGSHIGTLFMFFNLLVAGNSKITFIQLDDPKINAVIKYNLFYGGNQILSKQFPSSQVEGSDNWMPGGTSIPEGFSQTITGQNPGFYDASNRDYRLKPESPFWKYSHSAVEYLGGDGRSHSLQIDLQSIQNQWRNVSNSHAALLNGYK